jgi:hypothetical protein
MALLSSVGGRTDHIPTEHFTGVIPNYKRDFRAECGEYVQASVTPNHIHGQERAETKIGRIHCSLLHRRRSRYMVVHVYSDKGILHSRWEALPMPDIVIELLNSLYESDEPKKGKKRTDANPPQRDNDVAARDEEGEALAAIPIVREGP